jgi:hypothetical protein
MRALLEPAALPGDADAAEGGVVVAVIPYLFAYAAMTLPGLLGRGKRRPPDPRAGFRPRAASYGDPVPVGWGTFLCPAPAWHRGRTDVAAGTVLQHQLVLGLCQGPITAVHSLRISDGSEDPSSLADVPWADVAARGASLQLGTLTGHTPIANPSFTRETTNDISFQLDTVNNVGRITLAAGSTRSFLPTLYGATQLRILEARIGHPEPNPEGISYYLGRYPYGSGPDFTVVSIADKEIVVANPVATNANWTYLTLHPDNEAVCGGAYVLFDPVGLWHFPGFANIRADPLDVGRLYRPLDPSITVTPAFAAVVSAFRATAGPESIDAEGLDALADMVGTAYWAAAVGVTIQGDVGADGTAASSARNYGRASELGYVSGAMREQRPVAEHMQDVLDAMDCVIFDSEEVLKVRPLGDAQIVNGDVTFTPYVTPVYSIGAGKPLAGGTEPAVRMTAASTAQAFNVVSVAFRDRGAVGASYRRSVVTAYDQADIDRQKALHGGTGKLEAPVLELPWITSAAHARKIAQIRLQRARAVRHSQRVRLGWRDGALLEQMDLILLNDARLGLVNYPVRISAIEEDDDGTVTLETVDWPADIASAPQYATTSSDATSPGVNADPGEASAAVVLPVPAYLSSADGPEVWVAATGAAAAYYGADVYLSSDGVAYQRAGRIIGRSTMGILGAALASGTELDETNTIAVNLAGSRGVLTETNDAGRDALSTLCWVDGELLSYRDVAESTNEPNVYTLESLRRGAFGTTIGAHAAGSRFVRLDETVLRARVPASWFGSTVYVKILPFNASGGGQPALGDVTAFSAALDLPADAGAGVGPGDGTVLPGQAGELWPNGTSEINPPPGSLAKGPAWNYRYNAGSGAWAGSWVRRMTVTGVSFGATSVFPGASVAAIPGHTYTLEVRGKRISGAGDLTISIAALDASGNSLGGASQVVTADAWARGTVSFVVPSDAISIRPALSVSTAAGTTTEGYYDAISFYRSSTTPPTPSASVSPSTVSGAGYQENGPGQNATATTNAATVTAGGGVPVYTYAWEYVSGDTATVNSPTSATTTFTRTAATNSSKSGLYRCVVTDHNGSTVATSNVTVNTTHTYLPP